MNNTFYIVYQCLIRKKSGEIYNNGSDHAQKHRSDWSKFYIIPGTISKEMKPRY